MNLQSRAMRPAIRDYDDWQDLASSGARGKRVLIVDLNNFATFPTLAIGILVASMRNAGHNIDVLCPLAHGVPAGFREKRETVFDHIQRRINLATWKPFLKARDAARQARLWWLNRPNPKLVREVVNALDEQPDIILLSAYLQHYRSVFAIGRAAKERGIPMIVGGPMFNIPGTAEAWSSIPGLTAVYGGEADVLMPELLHAATEDGDLMEFDGITLPDGRVSMPAPPLRDLDQVPVPDFTDFPWDRYPFTIVPVMTGRGCQWSRCVFCSDVVSANGRSFRTRSVENVMLELREQARRHNTTNFLFLDLKLNSNPHMLRGITEQIQDYVPGAQWIGTVHVDLRKDNGLSHRELKAAAAAGMRRVSFGLETGSQRLLDAMDKGSSVEANSAFIRNAHDAGLSIRCTMFSGFPGETAEDMEQTADFLEAHEEQLDRVRFNAFSVLEDTPIYETLRSRSPKYPEMSIVGVDHRNAKAQHHNNGVGDLAYRRAKARALRAVYRINRREVRITARAFDGLM